MSLLINPRLRISAGHANRVRKRIYRYVTLSLFDRKRIHIILLLLQYDFRDRSRCMFIAAIFFYVYCFNNHPTENLYKFNIEQQEKSSAIAIQLGISYGMVANSIKSIIRDKQCL